MHLLFCGREQTELLECKRIEKLLRYQSIKVIVITRRHLFQTVNHRRWLPEQEGKQFDSPASAASIPAFVKTYSLNLDELLEPDITKYKTFNEFFYRYGHSISAMYLWSRTIRSLTESWKRARDQSRTPTTQRVSVPQPTPDLTSIRL